MYHVLVLGPEHTATHQVAGQGSVLMGRAEEAEVRLVDPLASRNHAVLHVGSVVELEDLNSANGTFVRDQRLDPGQRVTLLPGESITIGSTIVIVQRREPPMKPRRVWPHGYFETRLIEECARTESVRGTFAVVRLHVAESAAAARAEAVVTAALRPGDLLAAYGPAEYEILMIDTGEAQSQILAEQIVSALARDGIGARSGIAFFPTDGTSPQALVSRACSLVRGAEEHGNPRSPDIVVRNRAMRELYEVAERAARGNINILIIGETGVGKEVFAQTIHRLSARAGKPLVCLNCAALSESLLESELFGHEKGAFTGATQGKEGLLEAAGGGSILLDEVGEMSLGLQAKLLRAIETRQVLRVGSTRPRAVDVRFVAATNRDLEEEVAAKRFRQDLYFRLNGMTLSIPPLRERPEEIEPLATLFIGNAAEQMGLPPPRLAPAALALLRAYGWPGNIRELRNILERALLLCSGQEITVEHLPTEKMLKGAATPGGGVAVIRPPSDSSSSGAASAVRAGATRDSDRQAIIDALARCAGNQSRAAELLGISRRTFCSRLKEYNIPRPRNP